jgi:GNAT superfamily N-acetyltransferase
MQVVLTSASKCDADRIAEIYLASRKQFLSYAPLAHTDDEIRTWIRQTLLPSGGLTKAVANDSIVGFLAISHDQLHGWIDQLYLVPSATGSGLGSTFVERAKMQLGPPIRLYTFQANEGARRFYLRHGFREIELTDGSGNEEKTPDVLMEWP